MRPPRIISETLCIWVAALVHLIQPACSQSNYRFRHFDTRDGLSSDLAQSIFQDSLGFLWITQVWSVSRYDGYEFKTYRYDPEDKDRSLPNDILGPAYLDRSGNFWVTSSNQKNGFLISRYDRTIDGFKKYRVPTDGYVWQVSFEKDDKTLWLSTEKGIYRFNTETNEGKAFLNERADSIRDSLVNYIHDISVLDSTLLIATGQGIWEFDKRQQSFRRPRSDPNDSAWFNHAQVYDIFDSRSDDLDNVWFIDKTSITKVQQGLRIAQTHALPERLLPDLRGYDTDGNGVFWFGSWLKGIYRYDPADRSGTFITGTTHDSHSLRSNKISDVKIDRDQNLWAATDRGISKLAKSALEFHNLDITNARIDQSSVFEADGDEYVIVDWNTSQHQLWMARLTPGNIAALKFREVAPGFTANQVNSFWKGRRHFWIAAWGTGVVGFPIDQKSGMILSRPATILSHSRDNANTISTNSTVAVWEDGNENLWIGTSGGGLNKVVTTSPYGTPGSVIRYQHSPADSTTIGDVSAPFIYPENDSSFWLATTVGLDLYESGRFRHFNLDNHLPSALAKTRDGIVFVGTGTGLFAGIRSDDRYQFIKSPILRNQHVLNIREDQLGRLWIQTPQGMTFYDHRHLIAIEFNENDGFRHHRAYASSINPSLTSSGMMVMSDATGLTFFEPSKLSVSREKTSPLLTSLAVNNRPAISGISSERTEQFATTTDISVLDELILDYLHNNFTLGFSAMALTSPENNRYRHKLEGYDADWIETTAQNRTATYTNLDPGAYTFKVRTSNHHGIWSENEKTLKVIILPPPWQTWWAYTLYGLALVLIAGYWRAYEIRRIRERNQAKQLREIDAMKTSFFTNISHEFRTPLTLILGPLRELYDGTTKEDPRKVLGPVIRNANRLLNLINQLLDISKLEAGKMQLNVKPVEVVEFLRDIASSYESLALAKKISYQFCPDVPWLVMDIDEEKIEKVVHNLISNAFRFTGEGGKVTLNFKTREKDVLIEVRDNGIGIDVADQEKIFDRFYQVDSSHTRAHEGSGLGLALAREFVLLHHGSITVRSSAGTGTTFTVSLPLQQSDRKNKNLSVQKTRRHKQPFPETVGPGEETDEKEPHGNPAADGQPVVLIVEDHPDMRAYIRKCLSGQFRILEADNGKTGLQQAVQTIPDLIISDVMMPDMDGYMLCNKIKTHELTSHIVFILLTAKADHESRLEGLETGADDYLAKPFDAAELRLIVRNRLEERRRMREHFSRSVTLEPGQIKISSHDEKFLTKALSLIEAHMDDRQYSVEDLSRDAGYSHMQFYRKIRALSGQTPIQFIRSIRLKRAADLLSNRSDNVAQIAFSVGFGSQSYFIKCFKEQYGTTPGEFIARSVKENLP